jgi:hypothetical protein
MNDALSKRLRFVVAVVAAVISSGWACVYAFSAEIPLDPSQIRPVFDQEQWESPYVDAMEAVGPGVSAFELRLSFAGVQQLHLVNSAGHHAAGFSVKGLDPGHRAFYIDWAISFFGEGGEPVGVPPLLANPLSGSPVDVSSGANPVGFLAAFPDFMADVSDIFLSGVSVQLGFYEDSALAIPLEVEFTSMRAELQAGMIGVVPIPTSFLLLAPALAGIGLLTARRKARPGLYPHSGRGQAHPVVCPAETDRWRVYLTTPCLLAEVPPLAGGNRASLVRLGSCRVCVHKGQDQPPRHKGNDDETLILLFPAL